MKTYFFLILFILLFPFQAYADIIFPAIVRQFSITFVVGWCASIAIAFLIVLSETFFLKKLLHYKTLPTFLLSFIINFISSLAGFFLLFFPSDLNGHILMYGNMRLGVYLSLPIGYLLTVMVEFLTLAMFFILKKNLTLKSLLKTTTIMNAFSYLILLCAIIFADIISHGKCFQS